MSSKNLILAIDQGTTSTRALVFDPAGDVLALAQKDLRLETPNDGWVEQNPEDIWTDTVQVCREAISKTGVETIAAIGITNQRETTILWDKKTGRPLYNAIVWQDRRTADLCLDLKAQGFEARLREKTGLLCDPYFSGTKLRWLLDNVDGAREKARAGDLAFGTVDAFLLWRLTGGRVHATDATNAARTMLFDIHTQRWDDALLDALEIPAAVLPEVRDSGADFGVTDKDVLGAALPVRAVMGDQHAALFGQACFERGMVKTTYGTGCFTLMNIGDRAALSDNRLLTTLAWRIGGKATYAMEGSIFVAGAAVQFLRDNLGIVKDARETEAMARAVPDSGGVVFVPALAGLGAPHWDARARGAIFGLTRGTRPEHIVRATLEAQAFQTRDLMQAMRADTGVEPSVMRVDGGLARNDFVCAAVAGQLGCAVERPANVETTAWGVAALAGLEAGLHADMAALAGKWHAAARFEPAHDPARDESYARWQRCVHSIMS